MPPPSALLKFFTPQPKAAVAQKGGRGPEIAEELVALTASSEGGIKASPALRAEVEALVEELASYGPRAPARR